MQPGDLSRRILFVEDDKDDVFLIQYACKRAGITEPMSFVENGQRAVAYLQAVGTADAPSLIFLDLNMPVMSGFDFLRWLRHHDKWRNVPVIVLTTSQNPADIASAYELGANAYVVKPSDPVELIEMFGAARTFWLTHNQVPSA